MTENAVVVRSVWKKFRVFHEKNQYLKTTLLRGRRARYEDFWALRDVSFDIPHGSTFGIIGSNGSGKSTMLKCLAGILSPDGGSINVDGKIAALLELGAGFHPDLSGRENIYLNGAILGMTKSELERKFDEIVDFSGLDEFIDTPVKNYSSGMTVRLGFAVAINVNPEILLIDEVLAVGDLSFQQKCLERINDMKAEGRTIVIVSHGLSEISQLCDSAAWISAGELVEIGPATSIVDAYTNQIRGAVKRVNAPSGSRWGSGEVQFEDIQLLDNDANPETRFQTYGPLYLRCTLRSSQQMPGLSVQVIISQINGKEIWRSSTHRMGWEIPAFEDRLVVQLNIPDLNLLEGTYDISAAITDPSEVHVFDQWERGLRFDVTQEFHVEQGQMGLLNRGTHWCQIN
jgi:lipopolysaccharide transport system ATP-binding protein